MDDMFVREWLDTIPHIEDDLRTGAFEMNCKQCGRPIFESIAGEPICERCWTVGQQDDESKAVDAAIDAWCKEQAEEAARCRRLGICYVCEEPLGPKHICWSQAKEQANV